MENLVNTIGDQFSIGEGDHFIIGGNKHTVYLNNCIESLKNNPNSNIDEIEKIMRKNIPLTALNTSYYPLLIKSLKKEIAKKENLQSTTSSTNYNFPIFVLFKYIANIIENISKKKPSTEFNIKINNLKEELINPKKNIKKINEATQAVKNYLIKEIDSYLANHPEDLKNKDSQKNQKIQVMKKMRSYLIEVKPNNAKKLLEELKNMTDNTSQSRLKLWDKGFRSNVRLIKEELDQFIENKNTKSPKR